MKPIVFLLSLCLLLSACQSKQDNNKLYIVTTTGMLGDAVQQIVGNKARVDWLMGPGVDPHLYKASHGDLKMLREADIIVYNGVHLEGKMQDVLEKLKRDKPVIAAADGLEEADLLSFESAGPNMHDPHIWFDVALWRNAISYTGKQLAKIDKKNEAAYTENLKRYTTELDSLDTWVRDQISTIPPEQRVLVTAHDAFEYFSRAYAIETRGLQGISTVSDYGLRDISDLVDFLVSRNIKAVFVESSVPAKPLQAVIEGAAGAGHHVRIGGSLYSDALGSAGTEDATYIGAVKHNVRLIVSALK